MKLSKSKLALAKVINENGGWHGSDVWLFSTQSGDGVLKFWASKPKALKGCVCTEWSGGCRLNFALSRVIKNWHQTILSREEYYQAYPKADADGWIEWKGGECPVEPSTKISVRYRNGGEFHRNITASSQRWSNNGWTADIIAYRPHKPEVKPEFCESVMRSIPDPEESDVQSRLDSALEIVKAAAPHLLSDKYKLEGDEVMGELKPTIEQLAQDYRNKLDFAKRKQQEADDANMESDAALSQLEDAIAAIGFVITPLAATEKEPEMASEVKVGDEVECIRSNVDPSKYMGMNGTVLEVDDSSTPYLVDFGGVGRIWCHDVKFIRRP